MVKPSKDKRKIINMFGGIFNWTTGPLPCGSPADPGCNPGISRGIIKIKNGTVTPAMMEYTDDKVARRVSSSIAERRTKYAP